MFDVLTYTKGGAVLRMIEQWLGPDTFRDGIRRYLATHAHANTETHDLWDALAAVSGHPIREIMEPWIFQAGYPAISVSLDGDTIRLTQRRFAPSLPDDTSTWPVPLIVRQASPEGEVVQRVLVGADGLDLPLAHPDALVMANAGSTAFVRTFYDDELRARLTRHVQRDLSAAERQSLVDDAWAIVVAGQASVSSFLDLAAGFSEEASPSVWRTLLGGLRWIDRFLEGAARERFREDVRALVAPTLRRLGWDARDDDTYDDKELRGDLIRAMGILGDDPRDAGPGARGRGVGTVRPCRRAGRGVGGHRRRGVHRGRTRLRDLPGADGERYDAAGTGSLSLRLAHVPRPGSHAANAWNSSARMRCGPRMRPTCCRWRR